MSKNSGNFLSVRNSLLKYGADASRLTLADAGDGLDVTNFDEKTTNAILRPYFDGLVKTILSSCKSKLANWVLGSCQGE